ncbi:MAG: hypothetical protein ACREDQ_04470 [Limisphaerales bacterium]
MKLTNHLKPVLAAVVAASAVIGCKRDHSQAYYAPKEDTQRPPVAEAAPVSVNSQTLPPQMGVPPGLPALNWTLPSGWQEKPATGMRAASFTATGANGQTADISVIPLPISGHELDLVNMWRQQVQLPPTTQADADKASEPLTIAGNQGKLFQFASAQPIGGKSSAGIIVAELSRGTMSWFFKLAGDESFVVSQKPAFFAFLQSVQFSEQTEALPPGHPAIGGADQSAPTMSASPAGAGKPALTVPAGWQEVPAAQFLLAEYSITGANSTRAEVNVAELSGNGGGVLANVNRWRRQLGLPPATDADLATMTSSLAASGSSATVVDLTGADSNTGKTMQLVGVILPLSDQTWFYKLMGDDTVVAQQKDAFLKFVQSAKYANTH